MSSLHKVAVSQAAPAKRAVKLSIDGFHYKLSAGCLYLDQMLGPVFRLPLLIEGQLWQPRVIEQSCHPEKWTMQTRQRCVGSAGLSVARHYFLDAKGETHGLSESTTAWSNENRPAPLAPIMCDIFDFRLISSPSRSPKLNAEPVSCCYFIFCKTLSLWRPPFNGRKWLLSHGTLKSFSGSMAVVEKMAGVKCCRVCHSIKVKGFHTRCLLVEFGSVWRWGLQIVKCGKNFN